MTTLEYNNDIINLAIESDDSIRMETIEYRVFLESLYRFNKMLPLNTVDLVFDGNEVYTFKVECKSGSKYNYVLNRTQDIIPGQGPDFSYPFTSVCTTDGTVWAIPTETLCRQLRNAVFVIIMEYEVKEIRITFL